MFRTTVSILSVFLGLCLLQLVGCAGPHQPPGLTPGPGDVAVGILPPYEGSTHPTPLPAPEDSASPTPSEPQSSEAKSSEEEQQLPGAIKNPARAVPINWNWKGLVGLEKGQVVEFAIMPSTYLPNQAPGLRRVCVAFVEYRGAGYDLPFMVPDQEVPSSLCASEKVFFSLSTTAPKPNKPAVYTCKGYRAYKLYIKEEGGERLFSSIDFVAERTEYKQSDCRLGTKFGLGLDGECYQYSLYRIRGLDKDFDITQAQWLPEERVDSQSCVGKPKV